MQLLLDELQVEKILRDYHSLLGIGIGLYDKNYRIISLMPKKDWSFCNIIRQNREVYKACQSCDMKAFKHVEKTKELYVYKCHMGLYEAVAPIIDNDIIIGFIMVGQLLDERSIEGQYKQTNRLCKEYGFNEDDYKEAFLNLKQMGRKQIEAAANIMHACSAYLCFKNIVHVERGNLFQQINNYILTNLNEAITQDSICSYLNISKTTLYNSLINQTSMSLTSYVRSLRMSQAKELLTNSTMKIKDIADTVGINDYNYFSRLFKKTFNETPRSYRQHYSTNL